MAEPLVEPVVERHVVRLVVLDAARSILLFHTRDVENPDLGMWWELPGGGIEPGETWRDAAVRELREETGFVVSPTEVGEPTWRRTATFRYRHERRLQHEVVVVVRLNSTAPAIDETGRFDYENEDYPGFRWWSVPDVTASKERFYPGRLPRLLPGFLRGERIDEPFERWS